MGGIIRKIKEKKIPTSVKASVALFVASLVTKGLAFITTPIYTRLLPASDYGRVSIYYTWMQCFGIIAMFCLCYGVFNCGMVDYPDERDDYSFSILILSNIITVCFTGILLCLYPLIEPFVKLKTPYILLMCTTFLFQPAYSFWAARQRYELKYKHTFLASILSAVLSPTIAILCLLINKNGDKFFTRIFAAEIPLLIMYIFFYIYLGVKVKFKLKTKYWKEVLAFNVPLIPHYLSTYLLNSSDKIMISYYISDDATAYYSVAYSIASIALIIWTAVDSSLVPYTFENLKNGNIDNINKITTPLVTIFGVGCFGVILLGPEFLALLAPDSYTEAVYAIPSVVGATFFQAQYLLYSNIIYYFKKSKYVLLGSITSVVINIILNILFIPMFGYLAAGYTTLIGFACQALIDYFGMKKVCDKNIYNAKLFLLLSVMIFVISIISLFLYKYVIVKYTVLAILLILAFCMRKKIISLFKVMKNK